MSVIRKVGIGVGVAVAVLIVMGAIGAATGGGPKANDTPAATSAADPTETGVAIGAATRDGQFKFTVTKVQAGITHVGASGVLSAKPQGQFYRVSLTVENIGDSEQDLLSDYQTLWIGKKSYAPDDQATAYDAAGNLLWKVNPGNKVNGAVIFDIPKGARPSHIELHDSLLSGGTTVTLT
jgi:Domain of unknown function (DUF4352)